MNIKPLLATATLLMLVGAGALAADYGTILFYREIR